MYMSLLTRKVFTTLAAAAAAATAAATAAAPVTVSLSETGHPANWV